jgi:hypothetical protein
LGLVEFEFFKMPIIYKNDIIYSIQAKDSGAFAIFDGCFRRFLSTDKPFAGRPRSREAGAGKRSA